MSRNTPDEELAFTYPGTGVLCVDNGIRLLVLKQGAGDVALLEVAVQFPEGLRPLVGRRGAHDTFTV